MICAALIVFLLNPGCKKDGGGNYLKATINGNSWLTTSVSVETFNTGSGTEPLRITGVLNNEIISIRTSPANTGSYPAPP